MDDSPHRRLEMRITGKVQGVWYRDSTRTRANRLGLRGWVRNCSDGSVELLAERAEVSLQQLVNWCREGPPAARVDGLEPTWSAPSGEFEQFSVRY